MWSLNIKNFNMRKLVFILMLGTALFSMVACGGQKQESGSMDSMDHTHAEAGQSTDTTTVHGQGKEYTSAYVCPMHCEGSGSNEPGKCPVCGMEYVAQNDHVKDGHTHQD